MQQLSATTTGISGASRVKQEVKKDFAAPSFEGSHPKILLTHSSAYVNTVHTDGN